MSRAAVLLSTCLVLACGAKTTATPDPSPAASERARTDLRCTERPPGGQRKCEARPGCRWGPALSCHGAEPPPEELEAEHQAYASGTVGDQITAGLTTMILRQAKPEPVYIGADCQYGELYGRSLVMRKVFRDLDQWAKAPRETVLISGETGTGKELAARAIHDHSNHDCHGPAPYIVRSCADFPASVVEAELFGTQPGAYTGARERPGVFEQAIGGTLFLDEIGDLPRPIQSKLLRVIENREAVRLGGTKRVDVSNLRLIVASHRDLREMIDEGSFRKDLYYRLNVLRVHMPRLRYRGEDIHELAEHFLASICRKRQREQELSPEAIRVLERHPWPGNVRELKNVITNAAYSTEGPKIKASDIRFQTGVGPVNASITGGIDNHLAKEIFGTLDEPVPWKPAKAAFRREYMRRLLEITNHDLSSAAKISGYNYDQFRKLVRKHGLTRRNRR